VLLAALRTWQKKESHPIAAARKPRDLHHADPLFGNTPNKEKEGRGEQQRMGFIGKSWAKKKKVADGFTHRSNATWYGGGESKKHSRGRSSGKKKTPKTFRLGGCVGRSIVHLPQEWSSWQISHPDIKGWGLGCLFFGGFLFFFGEGKMGEHTLARRKKNTGSGFSWGSLYGVGINCK